LKNSLRALYKYQLKRPEARFSQAGFFLEKAQ
jgi:hypothetical protein